MRTAGRSAAVIASVTAAACTLLLAGAGQAVTVTAGTWHTAREAPGTGALNKGGQAQIQSVSCAAAGKCSAGGGYTNGSGHRQAFVAGQG